MFWTQFLTFAGLALAVIASFLSLWALKRASSAVTTVSSISKEVTRLIDSASMRSLQQLDAALTEQESSLSSLNATVRRLSSRLGMQDSRARQKQEQLPANFEQLPPAQRKQILRTKLAKGELTAVKDDGTAHEGV